MIKGDEVYTSTEIKYSVVHQYDRVFYLKEKIDKKYA
jgi:hypothetical protein